MLLKQREVEDGRQASFTIPPALPPHAQQCVLSTPRRPQGGQTRRSPSPPIVSLFLLHTMSMGGMLQMEEDTGGVGWGAVGCRGVGFQVLITGSLLGLHLLTSHLWAGRRPGGIRCPAIQMSLELGQGSAGGSSTLSVSTAAQSESCSGPGSASPKDHQPKCQAVQGPFLKAWGLVAEPRPPQRGRASKAAPACLHQWWGWGSGRSGPLRLGSVGSTETTMPVNQQEMHKRCYVPKRVTGCVIW